MRLVLLDVNGTLVPAGATEVDRGALAGVVEAVEGLRGRAQVGLCSDSPLRSLRDFGTSLGLAEGFPVVAENGNVTRIGGVTRVRVPFPGLAEVRAVIAGTATEHGLRRRGEQESPEFGGAPVEPGVWAFGAGRVASVAVFAEGSFVEAAGRRVAEWAADRAPLAVDSSPAHGFLGVHPYPVLRSGKAAALTALAEAGWEPVMVGDTMSDWVPPGTGVRCGFVGGALVTAEVRAAAWALARSPGAEGVAELLRRIAEEADERGTV
ncbi:hypothetical protein [Saccharothrix lopnurensis]|uniref:Hydroxymethylpyrimidine pyrophosphatase-like HAD family hydrolase n=1 Tax=Saccharothrix lopnurensis TaxID=1670621 RepID=A0ABW1PBY9_9PSEU